MIQNRGKIDKQEEVPALPEFFPLHTEEVMDMEGKFPKCSINPELSTRSQAEGHTRGLWFGKPLAGSRPCVY